MYLFDTDHLGILQRETAPEFDRIRDRMTAHDSSEFYASIVSFQEQVRGWNAYLNSAKTSESVVRAFAMFEGILQDFSSMQIMPFDETAAEVFESLRQQRVRVGTMDLRIASIAIAKGLILLSRNLSDFHLVPGLSVEDWTISVAP
jgi:tRNA(fMet)-specific endonuclease VapC